jgi:hypothetical protein
MGANSASPTWGKIEGPSMNARTYVRRAAVVVLIAASTAFVGCSSAAPATSADATALEHYRIAERIANEHLKKFDTLDFDVFSNQKWDRLKESHSPDILVHWPDGHVTKGIDRHIADLKAMFVYAPDTRVTAHPQRIGSGEWTAVTGVMEATFSKPMPGPNGKMIPPTGKKVKLPMATVGHWKNGVMDEEYLFWDNAAYMSQMGVGQ